MHNRKSAFPTPPDDHPARPVERARDPEDQADEFEDELAAEMIRTGAIEQW